MVGPERRPRTLVLGATIVLTDLLIRDTSGATGLPPLLGWGRVLPCMAGVVAVVLLWTNHEPSSEVPFLSDGDR